jgi:restriction system protein
MQAEHSMFVAVGTYTPDATVFAAQVGMTLVDGDELLRIIAAGLGGVPLQLPRPDTSTTPACPECGSAMLRRMARRGPNAGGEFWGCSTFPTCRGTEPILEDTPAAS